MEQQQARLTLALGVSARRDVHTRRHLDSTTHKARQETSKRSVSRWQINSHGALWSAASTGSSNTQSILYFSLRNNGTMTTKPNPASEHLDRVDLALVLTIDRLRSMTAAAAELGWSPPAVTKRLAALERRLGCRLFFRTTRQVLPTPEAEAFCERAAPLLQALTELGTAMAEGSDTPRGRMRVAATFGFGRAWVAPALGAFQALHPGVTVDLTLTETLPDLAAEGFDGAVWLWPVRGPREATYSARRLARNRRVLVAAPSYLRDHGVPSTLADLAQHACLLVREHDAPSQRWALPGWPKRLQIDGPLTSNSGEVARDWCLAGRGIMLRSEWDVALHLQQGDLVRVLPQFAMADADVQWLAPARVQRPLRQRLLVAFLAQRFHTQPWLPKPGPATATKLKRSAATAAAKARE